MTTRTSFVLACVAVFACADGALALQAQPAPSGHWVGSIAAGPGINVEVDLAPKAPGVWHGTISIPSQGTKGAPLAEVTVKGNAVSFAIKGAPGDPRFSGTLSQDAKTISGDFSQGGSTIPLSLAWKGEPKFEVPQKSPPVTKDLEGSWEGPLDVNGTVLRLVLKLANDANGAKGTLISLDQGAVEIPVSTIAQDGSRLKVTVGMISGVFDGELKAGELTGVWTQGPLSLPLVLKRAATSPPK
jgi:hypothetical protein